MSIFTRTLLALVASSFVASAALAGPGDLQAGGNGPLKVLKVQLGIKGPKTTLCPTTAETQGWVFTNHEGPVQVMIARKGQGVGAPFTIQAKKTQTGLYMANFKRIVQIIGPIDADSRLLAGGGDGKMSNWVPLHASCSIPVPNQPLPGFKFGG
jgi:hypothetical protein